MPDLFYFWDTSCVLDFAYVGWLLDSSFKLFYIALCLTMYLTLGIKYLICPNSLNRSAKWWEERLNGYDYEERLNGHDYLTFSVSYNF